MEKKRIHTEYFCINLEEKEYLIAHGFNYTFVKCIMDGDRKTTVWKFRKTPELLLTLADYYK